MRICTGSGKRKSNSLLRILARHGQGDVHKPFKNGKSYEDCFPNKASASARTILFRREGRQVVTLELALNAAAKPMASPPFSYVRDEMAALTAIWRSPRAASRSTSRSQRSPRARSLPERQGNISNTRRGQLNFSCATCHVQSPGERIRAKCWRPRSAFSMRCRSTVRMERHGHHQPPFYHLQQPDSRRPLAPQDDEYRDLEYYLSYVSNGLPISGPGARP